MKTCAEQTAENNIGITVATRVPATGNTRIVLGVGSIEGYLPVQNAPAGQQAFVFKNKDCGKIYIKTDVSIRCFVLEIRDGKFYVNPDMERKGTYVFPQLEMP